MARSIIEYTDNARQGTDKMNAMTLELYSFTPESITGAISLTSTALGKIHILTGTTSDYTVDLPTAVGNEGVIIFKGAAALTKIVTIQGVSGQTIDGESSRKISATGMITVMSDGANWVVIQEVGSWIPYTPVLAGWISDPTFDRTMYFRVGNDITVAIHSTANGTSNATTKTITLPFVADSVGSQVGVSGPNINNNVVDTTHGMIITRSGSNIADLYRNTSQTAWTNTSGCRINFVFTYKKA